VSFPKSNPNQNGILVADTKQQPTTSTDPDQELSGLSYGQALDELEELLDELEDADIDVDRLADRVARGVGLVRHCRARLAVVTADVDQVVADLVADAELEQADVDD